MFLLVSSILEERAIKKERKQWGEYHFKGRLKQIREWGGGVKYNKGTVFKIILFKCYFMKKKFLFVIKNNFTYILFQFGS